MNKRSTHIDEAGNTWHDEWGVISAEDFAEALARLGTDFKEVTLDDE